MTMDPVKRTDAIRKAYSAIKIESSGEVCTSPGLLAKCDTTMRNFKQLFKTCWITLLKDRLDCKPDV